MRHGVRVGRPTIVIHADLADGAAPASAQTTARVGFIVSKKVGNAVTRNRVKRRLRHLAASHLADGLRPDARIVVRALPAAATQPRRLAADFSSAWRRSVEDLEARP